MENELRSNQIVHCIVVQPQSGKVQKDTNKDQLESRIFPNTKEDQMLQCSPTKR